MGSEGNSVDTWAEYDRDSLLRRAPFGTLDGIIIRMFCAMEPLITQKERFEQACAADPEGRPTTPVFSLGEEHAYFDTNREAYLMAVGILSGALQVYNETFPTVSTESRHFLRKQAQAILFDETMGNTPGTSTD